MLNFILGALACAIMYTFFPMLAVAPSTWLRNGYEKLKKLKAGKKNG